MRKKEQPTLEQRVAALEHQVAELKAGLANGHRPKDWRRTIGIFTDDPGMQELFQQAMKIREENRARARRRHGKSRQVKS